jgi:hypothetical protein
VSQGGESGKPVSAAAGFYRGNRGEAPKCPFEGAFWGEYYRRRSVIFNVFLIFPEIPPNSRFPLKLAVNSHGAVPDKPLKAGSS